jgi:hypothetical protein
VEYLQLFRDEGDEALKQITEELTNSDFELVDFGPFWFQREFKREYVPGNIDYSGNTPLEPIEGQEGQERGGGVSVLGWAVLVIVGVFLLLIVLGAL